MDNAQLGAYLTECYEWLRKRQEEFVSTYEIASYDSYWYDQRTGLFQFKNGESIALQFPYIGIGSWSAEERTFMWDWANGFVLPERQKESARVKALTVEIDGDIFGKEVLPCEVTTAWGLVAVAARALNAGGVYRVPHDSLDSFLAILLATIR